MTVPRLPTLGAPPAPAPLRKIALEEHFGHPIVFMRDSDGRCEADGIKLENCPLHVRKWIDQLKD
jgi:hypothetical protein